MTLRNTVLPSFLVFGENYIRTNKEFAPLTTFAKGIKLFSLSSSRSIKQKLFHYLCHQLLALNTLDYNSYIMANMYIPEILLKAKLRNVKKASVIKYLNFHKDVKLLYNILENILKKCRKESTILWLFIDWLSPIYSSILCPARRWYQARQGIPPFICYFSKGLGAERFIL